MLSRMRCWAGVRRPLTALLSNGSAPSGNQSLTRSRELILSVLSTVPSPREARKFIDSVSGHETLRSQREFEERQAQLAIEQASGVSALVPGEFLHPHTEAQAPMRTLAALVCVDSLETHGVGKLLAQMQRIGVAPIVIVAANGDHLSAVARTHVLADAVEREGGRARPICGGVFGSDVCSEPITAAIADGQIPVVAPLAVDEAQRLVVLDTRSVTALARALAALERAGSMSVARLILLGSESGIAAGGELQRLVNLEEDYVRLEESCGQTGALQLMRTCLGILAPTAVGIVASVHADPSLVLKGLISERPTAVPQYKKPDSHPVVARVLDGVPNYQPISGHAKEAPLIQPSQFTLLRHGFRIQRHTSLDTCDLSRLRSLLESSFQRKLDMAYFERLRNVGIQVIVAGEYQGAVIVTHEKTSGQYLPYLDKFAVLPEVQGTGMADILWDELRVACPSCMWRSRNDNGVNRWYFDRSHGHKRSPVGVGTRWVFFWYQSQTGERVLTPSDVCEGVDVAQRIPPSFL
ncbi:Amino-acid acetyltransferase, mitochondrial [Coemansia pectinata]|uniref:Amino-acid acetyltransferase, mitochondrial n=1 Tax=Coemansia pectinata TaxID=1052879 RepID=A0A9W8LAV5_9FUNG|nr:Amino-acid acetyltransferase, mitochondrial [Coemansia pectinata]